MAFEATKQEWSELYTFFRLLSEGSVQVGTKQGKANESAAAWSIAQIVRDEHDGKRNYIINEDNITIKGENISLVVPREYFGKIADLILSTIKESKEDEVPSPDVVETFLDKLNIYDLQAKTEDRTDLSIAFFHIDAPLTGVTIRSRMGRMNPILDGGRTANLKFEQVGVKFPNPLVNKINAIESANGVAERILAIETNGGVLKYSDVADKVFRSNLLMIDLHFPRMLAEMLRILYLDDITRVSELTEAIKQLNPLKIKDELINKHLFYEHKMKQFLSALTLGMRPAKIYNGEDSAVEGLLLINGDGGVVLYHKSQKQVFDDFLFFNTRFEKGSTEKDKYGYLEKENGVWFFKLNAKIGIVKR
ncbi:HpaII family restriction endonuclease [Bacteroides sp. 214]|uniref:HpaII family restriction endonuclease n=1 Tax=Bacteroides sp. 214 TaxID=2302935 RepID=UPI0013D5598C|nr:HpaII family restriction endonuclease [Bacteroides sp. 214]NDW12822.1 HpaII family restriction endonuclease [Bacteroides sp. 214]